MKLKRIRSEGIANNSYLLTGGNEVAAICSVGNRANIAASMLKKERFKEVYKVLGGMTPWTNLGCPTQKYGLPMFCLFDSLNEFT